MYDISAPCRRHLRRGAAIFLLAVIVFALAVFALYGDLPGSAACAQLARSACYAAELQTGTELYSQNADVRLPMASTTKIMTALIVCERCDLDRVVTVPDCAVGKEGSSIYLKAGERIDVRDLLYGLMLRSGNDAAAALAVICSGTEEAFVDEMNGAARALGAVDTHFCNPSGLPDDDHYTTARDLCVIACAAMKNNTFRTVVGAKSWRGKFRSYSNKNKMLFNYRGAIGIKTGYTVKAGRCLVSAAKRGVMEVVCVVLNEHAMYEKSAAILDGCFADFAVEKLNNDKIFLCGGRSCALKQGATLVLPRGGEVRYICLPYEQNGREFERPFGQLKIYLENDLIFSGNLYSID